MVSTWTFSKGSARYVLRRYTSCRFNGVEPGNEHVRPTSLLKRFITPEKVGPFVAFVGSPLAAARPLGPRCGLMAGWVLKSAF
jgi:hypothetical protein